MPAMIESKRRLKKITSKMSDFVLWFDRFGTPVTLNFEGNDSIKSYFGSFVSFVIVVVVAMQAYQKSVEFLTKSTTNVLIYKDAGAIGADHWSNIDDLGMHMAFEVNDNGVPIDMNDYEWVA